jgi:phosphate transport system protein
MTPNARHILRPFDTALNELREEVLIMASLTERNIRLAEKGLMERDSAACKSVILNDEAIDRLEVRVDQDGIALLLRFHPVATDMRRVISTMKLGSNLERIADQATNIARRSIKLNDAGALSQIFLLGPMFQHAVTMVKDSLTALTGENTEMALEIKERDKTLDQMNKDLAEKFTEAMSAEPDHIALFVHLLFVAGSLERIGDHAKSIAEDAVYLIDAKDIRHIPSGTI